jgi:C4-dicarboxylate transporter DctM subunit
MAALLFGIFVVLFLLRVPIAISLAMATIVVFFLDGYALPALVQKIFSSLDSPTLMAIPGFVFAGVLLAKGGISRYLIDALRSWVGHFSGGLAVCTILACMFFAAISGSSPATAAAVGAIMIPAMVNAGYSKKYAMGLVAASGTLGIIIPPSIPLILYGVVAEESIGDLFMAGIIPGIMLGSLLIVSALIFARINNYGRLPKASWNERITSSFKAIPGALLPVLILGGIYTGVATPTESSVVAAVYAILISALVYRELKWKDVRPVIVETVNISSMIYMIIAAAMLFATFLTTNQIPQTVANWIIGNNFNIVWFMVLTNFMFFIMGTFLESVAIILITLPMFLPILDQMGINVYHFAIIMIVNMELAMITPPVGLNLFVVSGIAKEPLEKVIRAVVPFILLMIVGLILVIVFPELSLFLLKE